VMSSPTARTVLTAVQWMRQPVTAQTFVSTRSAGIDWCCMRLEKKGLAISTALAALRARES
jgi:hypothetical protein